MFGLMTICVAVINLSSKMLRIVLQSVKYTGHAGHIVADAN